MIHRNINEDFGIDARVTEIDRGFSVTVRDLESGEVLPVARIFSTAAKAIEFADCVAEGRDPTGNRGIEVTL